MNEQIRQHLSGGEPQQTPSPGIARVQSAIGTPATCKSCGGEWFFIVDFNKYSNMYSSMPGGDLNALTQPQTLRICMCGEIFEPNIGGVRGGRTPNTLLNDFLKALRASKDYRAALAVQVGALAEAAVPREDHEGLAERVKALEALVQKLSAPAPAEAEKPQKTAKPVKGHPAADQKTE